MDEGWDEEELGRYYEVEDVVAARRALGLPLSSRPSRAAWYGRRTAIHEARRNEAI